jgi:integrase
MTGIREGELLQARWEWIQGDTLVVQGRTKSKKIRRIPLPTRAIHELVMMLSGLNHGPTPIPHLGLIFPGKKGKPHAKGWLRQALARADVKGLGMHRLRATFATLLLRNKINPKDAQEMLGHRYIHTTMKYSEGSMESKRKAQEELWA